MGVINTGSFAKALWPGINAWYGAAYKEWSEEYGNLFDIESSSKAFEEEVGISGFGLAAQKTEGRGIQYDEASQTWVTRYQHATYALGFVVTQEMIEDNQYDLTIIGTHFHNTGAEDRAIFYGHGGGFVDVELEEQTFYEGVHIFRLLLKLPRATIGEDHGFDLGFAKRVDGGIDASLSDVVTDGRSKLICTVVKRVSVG